MNKTHLLVWAVLPALLACPPAPPPAPEVPKSAVVKSFSASPSAIQPDEETTLTWETENATSIVLRTINGKPIAVPDGSVSKGTVQVKVEESTIFVLSASGEGGSDSALASVSVAKGESTPLFTAIPTQLIAGESSTLVWNAPGVAAVEIKDAAGQVVISSDETSGSVEVTPAFSTTYTLTAGEFTRSAEVEVRASILSFEATPPAVAPAGEVTLQWKVGGADKVTVETDGRGVFHSETDPTKIADGSITASVPANLPSFGVVKYVLKAHVGTTVTAKTLEVYVGADPRILNFSAPNYVRPGDLATVSWKTAFADQVEIVVDGQVVHVATSLAAVAEGSKVVSIADTARKVEIRARNAKGGSASKELIIAPVGVTAFVSFDADLATVTGGQKVTLRWQVTDARRARIEAKGKHGITEITGLAAENGTVEVYPNETTEYVLYADNTLGDEIAPQSEIVTVTQRARLNYAAEPVPATAKVELTAHSIPGGGAIVGLPNMVKNAPGASFIDISATGIEADVVSYDAFPLPAPFTMPYFGKWVTTTGISIAEYGVVIFATADKSVSTSNSAFPTTSLEPYSFAPFWDDLDDDVRDDSRIFFQLDGYGYQQRLIVQWDKLTDDSATDELTFQVQLYGDGRVVYAYKTLHLPEPSPSVGLVNEDESQFLYTTDIPVAGDTFTFFGPVSVGLGSDPVEITAIEAARAVRVDMGNGGWLEVDVKPEIIPAKQFTITEVMYNPTLADGEWIEITNHSAQPFDLNGWSLDFGDDVLVPINQSFVLPAQGSVILGQTAASAEDGTTGGAPVGFVYGTTVVMDDSEGSVALVGHGVEFSKASWSSTGTAGASLQAEERKEFRFSSATLTSLTCASTAGFGATGQRGTPGSQNTPCFPWQLSEIPSAFQPIAATGTAIWSSTTLGAQDDVHKGIDFTATGGRAVTIRGATVGNATQNLWVSSNGWISLSTQTSSYLGNPVRPETGAPNNLFAIFWDDLEGNAGTTANPSGVYWQQFDPDGTPSSGDEYTLISWENWARNAQTASLNFQIKIEEATGFVEFHYGSMTAGDMAYANGLNASAWMETADGTTALAIGANQAGFIQSNTAYRFTYTP